jgi:RNA polymerase sigma factor (sigma-70 family)
MTRTACPAPGVDATLHLRLAAKVASRYKRIGEIAGFEWDDLVQEAHIGLLQAVRDFDPGLGLEFSTLAYQMIRYRLLRVLKTPLRRVDRLKRQQLPVDDHLTDEQAVQASALEVDRAAMAALLARLSPKDLEVIRARFGLGMNPPQKLEELAVQYRVSKQRMHQRVQHALAELQRLARVYGMTC